MHSQCLCQLCPGVEQGQELLVTRKTEVKKGLGLSRWQCLCRLSMQASLLACWSMASLGLYAFVLLLVHGFSGTICVCSVLHALISRYNTVSLSVNTYSLRVYIRATPKIHQFYNALSEWLGLGLILRRSGTETRPSSRSSRDCLAFENPLHSNILIALRHGCPDSCL